MNQVSLNIFAATLYNGVIRSTNSGQSWSALDSGLENVELSYLGVSSNSDVGSNLLAGSSNSKGILISYNNGTNWSIVDSEFVNTVYCFAVSHTKFFAGASNGVYLSTDAGLSWTLLAKVASNQLVIVPNDKTEMNIYGISYGVYLSTNEGISWTDITNGLPKTTFNSAVGSEQNIFIGADKGVGVFLTTDNGANWTDVNSGLLNNNIRTLAASNTYLFAGTEYGGVWKRPLSEMITGVGDNRNDLPKKFSLHQNYPNPFNPSTTIKFEIPISSEVKLNIYNILGEEVKVLISGYMNKGIYNVKFEAKNLASGIYIYSLKAGGYVYTKKMILIK